LLSEGRVKLTEPEEVEKKVYLMIGTFSGIETDCSSVSRIY